MSQPHDAPTLGWVPAWSDLQGRSAHPTDAGFVLDTWPGQDGEGQEYVVGRPAPGSDELPATAADQPGMRLTVIFAGAAGTPSPAGFSPVAERFLLSAPTAGLNTGVDLPENAQVALAPMETYDAVEITVFDHPVAKGRIQVRDGVAAVAITEVPAGPDEATFTRALFAAMAEEAFLHGAEDLYMVVEPGEAAAYEESGWALAGRLLSFEKE